MEFCLNWCLALGIWLLNQTFLLLFFVSFSFMCLICFSLMYDPQILLSRAMFDFSIGSHTQQGHKKSINAQQDVWSYLKFGSLTVKRRTQTEDHDTHLFNKHRRKIIILLAKISSENMHHWLQPTKLCFPCIK